MAAYFLFFFNSYMIAEWLDTLQMSPFILPTIRATLSWQLNHKKFFSVGGKDLSH